MRTRLNPDWQIHQYQYRVYIKGGFRFFELPESVQTEAKAMRSYWNELVVAAKDSTLHYQEILNSFPELAALQAQEKTAIEHMQGLIQQKKKARQRARSLKTADEAALKIQLQAAREQLKTLRVQIKPIKQQAKEQRKEALATHHEAWDVYLKGKRQTAPCHWGNREYLLDTFKAALQAARKTGVEVQEKKGPFRELHFRQPYTSGISADQLWTHQGRVRLTHSSDQVRQSLVFWSTHTVEERHVRWRPLHLTGQFQVGPTMLDFDCVYHRPFPPHARIKSFDLVGREVIRSGGRLHGGSYAETKPMWEWHLVVAVEHPPAVLRALSGSCGIDIGWRMRPNGQLRVGYLVSPTGSEEICFPEALVADYTKTIALQQLIDTETDEAAHAIQLSVDEERINYPPLLVERLAKPRWTRPVLFWLLRETHDEHIRDILEKWAHTTTRLYQEQRRLYLYCQHYRNDWYRKLAWRLACQFAEITIEDLDLRELRKKETREGKAALNLSEHLGRFANLSFHRRALIEATTKTGAVIRKVPAKNTTLECHGCGALIPENTGALFLECPNGHRWDQDVNAGINLLHAPHDTSQETASFSEGA